MKLVQLIEFLRKRLRAVVRVCLLCSGRCWSSLDAIPGMVHKEHAHTAAERFPAFWAVFGFVGCAVLILVSKAFGHAGHHAAGGLLR